MRSDDESKAIDKVLASKAAQESRGECELCRATGKELRPYGPHGQRVCFPCGMKNEAAAERQFRRAAFGEVIN